MKEPLLEPIFRHFRVGKIINMIPTGAILCDIGCGPTGELLFKLSDRISFGYGFDNLAKEYRSDKIALTSLNVDQENLPLMDESVNVVTCLAVLEHLSKPLHVMREAYRILKPGGIFILTTPTPLAKPVLEFLAYRLNLVSKREIDEHKHYYNREELYHILQQSGFLRENIRIDKFEFGFNSIIYAIR